MSGETKSINDMTDEEIGALDDEQLAAAIAASGEAGGDADGDDTPDGDGEPDGDGADDDGDGADAGDSPDGDDAPDGDGAGDGDGLSKEDLERLANEDDPDGDGAPEMVPRARLNEVLESNRDLRMILRHVAGSKPEEPAPAAEEPKRPEYDFKAARREYHRLLNEGETEAAEAKFDEIEEARDALHAFDLQQATRAAEDRAYQRAAADQTDREVKAVVAEMYKRYPFLDNGGKQPNEAAILAVNAKAKQLVAKGKSPAEALHEAATKIGGEFAKVLGSTEKPGKTGTSAKDGRGGGKPAPGTDPRSKDAMRRNLGVRQPATNKAGVGTRGEVRTLDLSQMTDEQIEKLSPAELAEARGDTRVG